MAITDNIQDKDVPAHIEESVPTRYELSEEEQPAMNFQTIMACIVSYFTMMGRFRFCASTDILD